MTPEEALPLLFDALSKRMPRIKRNRRYSRGDADLPEMGDNLRASWQAFQKKARTNYGGLLCHSLAGRLIPVGVRVGTSDADSEIARELWRDNRLGLVFLDAIWNMLATSVGYVLTDVIDKRVVITSEKPEQMITLPDPVQPWRSRAALKTWTDGETDFAVVWVPGVSQVFTRKAVGARSLVATKWEADGEPVKVDGGVPVQVLENVNGFAEFEEHIDVLDRINLGKLNRLVITAMQAFRQRGIKGDLPGEDADGNEIDWGETFEPAPGALWELPDGIDVWESEQTDIRPLLEGEKSDARDFAAVTQAPMSLFIPDGANQSATAADSSREGEIKKAERRLLTIQPAFEGAILDALRLLGDADSTVEVQFAPPAHVSYQEKASAAQLARAAGMSLRWIARNIWGLSPDELVELETDLLQEQIMLVGEPDGAVSVAVSE